MSTSSPEIETVSPAADKAKLAAAALLVVGAVAAYYLIKQADWIRWSALILLKDRRSTSKWPVTTVML